MHFLFFAGVFYCFFLRFCAASDSLPISIFWAHVYNRSYRNVSIILVQRKLIPAYAVCTHACHCMASARLTVHAWQCRDIKLIKPRQQLLHVRVIELNIGWISAESWRRFEIMILEADVERPANTMTLKRLISYTIDHCKVGLIIRHLRRTLC